jgi:hypothetical protein
MENTPSSGRQSSLGHTEHVAIMARLNIIAQPRQMSFHERFHVGGEVDLTPATDPHSTVNLILEDSSEKAILTVHSELLCYYSPYFHDILDGGGVSAKARVGSKMLRREWRWESESDVDSMEGNGYGDAEDKVEVDVRIKFPGDLVRQIVLHKDEIGDVGPRAMAAFVDVRSCTCRR